MRPQRMAFVSRPASAQSSKLQAFGFSHHSEVTSPSKGTVGEEPPFGDTMHRSSTQSRAWSFGKSKNSFESAHSGSSIAFGECACSMMHLIVLSHNLTRRSVRGLNIERLCLWHCYIAAIISSFNSWGFTVQAVPREYSGSGF